MSEATEADQRTAQGLVAFYRGLRDGSGEDPAETGDLAAAIARALADEREKARAAMVESIRAAWDQQCAGYKDMICESCRAYSDAIAAVGR